MGDIRVAMAIRSVAALCCLLVAYGAAENPVQSLDAGEIAEIDDGDFVDVFDSPDVSPVDVAPDTADMATAMDTWEVLYGDSHPSKLGETESTRGEDPAVVKAKAKVADVRKQLLDSSSAEESAKLNEKLGAAKDALEQAEASDKSPAEQKKSLEEQISKEVKKAQQAKASARNALLKAKDEAT